RYAACPCLNPSAISVEVDGRSAGIEKSPCALSIWGGIIYYEILAGQQNPNILFFFSHKNPLLLLLRSTRHSQIRCLVYTHQTNTFSHYCLKVYASCTRTELFWLR